MYKFVHACLQQRTLLVPQTRTRGCRALFMSVSVKVGHATFPDLHVNALVHARVQGSVQLGN